MLSILIPVYNFDVTGLAASLQASETNIPFEIICLDDGSAPMFKAINKKIAGLENIIYEELPQNIGRSKIRNLLAERAKYEYLLFLDCDSTAVSGRFLSSYVSNVKSGT